MVMTDDKGSQNSGGRSTKVEKHGAKTKKINPNAGLGQQGPAGSSQQGQTQGQSQSSAVPSQKPKD